MKKITVEVYRGLNIGEYLMHRIEDNNSVLDGNVVEVDEEFYLKYQLITGSYIQINNELRSLFKSTT